MQKPVRPVRDLAGIDTGTRGVLPGGFAGEMVDQRHAASLSEARRGGKAKSGVAQLVLRQAQDEDSHAASSCCACRSMSPSRSEERSVGKEGVSTVRSRGLPYH